jgi:ABC-type amino acid transport substrate-binding protein
LKIKFVPVTSESGIPAVLNGEIDLECGSTTNNSQRQAQVAFSPVMFVAGTKLLVKSGSPIEAFRDLGGKPVVVTAGTNNEQAMRQIMDRFAIDCRLVTAKDHADSYDQLATGHVDALAGDDVLLYGLMADHHAKGSFSVVGDFLSYEPYGIMLCMFPRVAGALSPV